MGKERDTETGLYYCGARYYAPWLGRWISCDPKALADGSNSYAYSRSNPVVRADPNGMQSQETQTPSETVEIWRQAGYPVSDGNSGVPAASLTGPIVHPGRLSLAPSSGAVPAKPATPVVQPTVPATQEVSATELARLAEALGPHLTYPKFYYRVTGTLQLGLAGVEAFGALSATETGVGTALLGAHAFDLAFTGGRQIISGREEDTLLFSAVRAPASDLGADDRLAGAIGVAGVTAAGIGLGALSPSPAELPLSSQAATLERGAIILSEARSLGVVPAEGTIPYFNAGLGQMSPEFLQGRTYAEEVNRVISTIDPSGTTITQTPGGAFASGLGLQGTAAGLVWPPLSADYAIEAGLIDRAGVVFGDAPSPGSIWVQTERPILRFFAVNYRVHLRVIQ